MPEMPELKPLTHVSISQIELWRTRPEDWKKQYILGETLPTTKYMAQGKGVHAGREAFHAGAEVEAAYMTAMELERSHIPPEEWDLVIEEGHKLLAALKRDDYMAGIKPWTGTMNACEVRVEVEIPGVGLPLLGFIDMLSDVKDKDGPMIRDLKVTKTKWGPAQIAKSLQRIGYWYAVRAAFGVEPEGFTFDFLLKGEEPRLLSIPCPPTTDQEIDQFIILCQDYWKELSSFRRG